MGAGTQTRRTWRGRQMCTRAPPKPAPPSGRGDRPASASLGYHRDNDRRRKLRQSRRPGYRCCCGHRTRWARILVLVGSAKPAADHLGPVKLAARGRGIEYCRHRACPPTEPTGAQSVSPLVTCAPLRPPPCGSPLQGRGPCAAISTSSSWPCHTCCSGDAKIRSESSRTERTRLGHQVIASAGVAQGGPFAWLCRSA